MMHAAAEGGSIELIRALHLRGMSLDDRNSDGRTPLMVAACEGKSEAALVLLELGADITVKDNVSTVM